MAQTQVLTSSSLTNGLLQEPHQNGSADPQTLGDLIRFSSGLILPPPEIKGTSLFGTVLAYLTQSTLFPQL